jgi:uncharacterized protein YciW
MSADKIDLTRVQDAVDDLIALVDTIGEVDVPHRGDNNKPRNAAAAESSRRLLLASHLCDRIKVALLDEHYKARQIT